MSEDYYTTEEMAEFLGYDNVRSLKNRLYEEEKRPTGDIPPFLHPRRGLFRFPKKEFRVWELQKTVRK